MLCVGMQMFVYYQCDTPYVTGVEWLCINPMILLVDNSDSPSIVEQLQQGYSPECYTFISDCS